MVTHLLVSLGPYLLEESFDKRHKNDNNVLRHLVHLARKNLLKP